MSNTYYINADTLIDGQVARAAQVKAELDAIQSGFAQLPPHNSAGNGFSIPIKLPDGVDPQDAVNKGQLTVHDAYIVGIQTDIENRQIDVTARQSNVQSLHDVVVAKEALVNPHYTAIDAVYANQANINTVSFNINSVNDVSQNMASVVDAVNQANLALSYRNLSQKYSEEIPDVQVEAGTYSAKHWAAKAAEQVQSGITAITRQKMNFFDLNLMEKI